MILWYFTKKSVLLGLTCLNLVPNAFSSISCPWGLHLTEPADYIHISLCQTVHVMTPDNHSRPAHMWFIYLICLICQIKPLLAECRGRGNGPFSTSPSISASPQRVCHVQSHPKTIILDWKWLQEGRVSEWKKAATDEVLSVLKLCTGCNIYLDPLTFISIHFQKFV